MSLYGFGLPAIPGDGTARIGSHEDGLLAESDTEVTDEVVFGCWTRYGGRTGKRRRSPWTPASLPAGGLAPRTRHS